MLSNRYFSTNYLHDIIYERYLNLKNTEILIQSLYKLPK